MREGVVEVGRVGEYLVELEARLDSYTSTEMTVRVCCVRVCCVRV